MTVCHNLSTQRTQKTKGWFPFLDQREPTHFVGFPQKTKGADLSVVRVYSVYSIVSLFVWESKMLQMAVCWLV